MNKTSTESIPLLDEKDLLLLLNDIKKKYGYDFLNYSRASILRRVSRFMDVRTISSFRELRNKILNEGAFFENFLQEVTVNVTEMFRDPEVFKALREKVYPMLETYPLIRIWHAGCATGEEVYSNAIALHEENLLQKSLIYATDINQKVLENAREGIFDISNMKQSTDQYIRAGGKNSFSAYYSSDHGVSKFSDMLMERMVFSSHNLVQDQSFNEFNLIICRNVMIYFNQDLQNSLLKLFVESLSRFGYLVLGIKESIRFSKFKDHFKVVDPELKIYKKID